MESLANSGMPNSEDESPNTYAVTVEQTGGADSEDYTFTIDGLSEDDPREADAFVSVDFGWPEEYVDANPQNNVMWVQCLQGYSIENCNSTTSTLTPGKNRTCGMIIEDLTKNVLSFQCVK